MINFYNNDPYHILGLGPASNKKDIRKAYRSLAMQYHPDRNPDNPGAVEKFNQVQRAYEILAGKKPESSISVTPEQYESRFSDDIHPFVGFYQAMRAYYAIKITD